MRIALAGRAVGFDFLGAAIVIKFDYRSFNAGDVHEEGFDGARS